MARKRAVLGPQQLERAKVLGSLPVIAQFCRRLDIRGIIDRACPVRDVAIATHGQVIEALVANRLTSAQPLCHVRGSLGWPRRRRRSRPTFGPSGSPPGSAEILDGVSVRSGSDSPDRHASMINAASREGIRDVRPTARLFAPQAAMGCRFGCAHLIWPHP